MTNRVSVVIPAYNAECTIEHAVESVVGQRGNHWLEIIIIDDGSVDTTAEVVRSLQKRYSGVDIKLLRKANGGVSSARNWGLKAARGEFIAFLDADDVWLEGKLCSQLSVMARDPSIVFLGTGRNSERYPFGGLFRKNGCFQVKQWMMLLKWWPSVPTVVMRREVFERIGVFDELVRHGEDVDYWLRVIECFPVHCVEECYVSTGAGKESYGEAGLSADLMGMHAGELRALSQARKRGQISRVGYSLVKGYCRIKFLRRKWIVARRVSRQCGEGGF